MFEGFLWCRFLDKLHSSKANVKPRIVMVRAVYFR